jgi:glycosyltransferase involved in cell wall biosynthesis
MNPEISLVALFYNEEQSVEAVIRDGHRVLQRMGVPFEIVAIQNGSLDRTPEILARLQTELEELRIVMIPVNRGAGYGALKGLYAAIGNDVVGIAGDGQVDLELIPKLYELKRQCRGDIAYGRRTSRPDGLKRAFISKSYNLLMRWVFGLRSKDVNGPPKIISRSVLQAMQLKSEDQFVECEMMLKAERMGLTMCSLDVQFHKRHGGTSTISWRDCRDYLRNLVVITFSQNDPWGLHKIPKSERQAAWIHYPDGLASAAEENQPSINLHGAADLSK